METSPLGEQLDALAQASLRTHAIVLLDPDGIIVGWNLGATLMLGYEPAEVLGRHFRLIYLAADVEADKPGYELREAVSAGSATDDNWLRRKDGGRIFASGTSEPVYADGLRGFVKIVRDVSDRRRIEDESQRRAQELADSDRHKDFFLAMLSHELRNPMAPITSAVEVLVQRGTTDPGSRHALDVIARQTRQLGHLISDLLEVTRIASGKLHLKRERVDLVELVRRAADAADHAIHARRQRFTRSLPTAPIHIDADAGRITQVVANLLDNAVKYTDPEGHIGVVVERAPDNTVAVRIHDDGVGIDENIVDHIFDMFKQDDRHLDRAQGGLGIGLALAHRLATMHGGTVTARSPGHGLGSEFTLVLPLPETPVSALEAPSAAIASVDPAAIVVMVVDDNVDGADSIAMLLRILGYSVHVAYDGIAAIELAASVHPDLVLLDIGLPGADGYSVARQLRERTGASRMLLVAMTGYGTDTDRARAQAAGFDHHLVKPVEPRLLEELLADVGRRLALR